MNERAKSALPVASGLLLAASTPPAPSPILPFIALVPLAILLRRLPDDPRGAFAAVGAGMVAGALQHAWGLRWLPFTLGAVAGPATGWVAFAAVLAVLAGLTGVAAWATHRLTAGPNGLPPAFALPFAWVGLEWALAHLPFGLAFPWTPLGLGLARWPATLGVAELVGIGGVTAWLALVSGLVAEALDTAPARALRAVGLWACALVLAFAPVWWGYMRAARLDGFAASMPVGRVTALALDVPPSATDPAWARTSVAAAERALASVAPGSTDLAVLPEMVLALDPNTPAGNALVERLRVQSERIGAPILVGALGGDDARAFNSAMLIGADGIGAFRADKRRLVPGVERTSAVHAPWLAPVEAGGYDAGEGFPVALAGPLRAGVLICYEVAFGADARRLVRNGANTLVALTSDAWFGGGSGARSAGIAQQMAHLTVRAVETRTSAVRSSNGGPAALIGPSGLELSRAAWPSETAAAGVVPEAPVPTLFVRTGDVTGPVAAMCLVALLVLTIPRRRHDSSM